MQCAHELEEAIYYAGAQYVAAFIATPWPKVGTTGSCLRPSTGRPSARYATGTTCS